MKTKFIYGFIFLLFIKIQVFADMQSYQRDVLLLVSKIEYKNQLKSELDDINNQIKSDKNNKNNWLRNRKLAKLSQNKSEKSDRLFQVYKEITELKTICRYQFGELIKTNKDSIDIIVRQLNENSDRKTLLLKLLDQKQVRDYLIDTQKYFSTVNEKTFKKEDNFPDIDFSNDDLRNDFVNVLQIKLDNLNNAKSSAQKEVNMRNKLNEFRDEIATFQEPHNGFSKSGKMATAIADNENTYDDWITDNNELNYDNSVNRGSVGNSFSYNFESIKSENDFLFLFEGQENETIELFIKRMDSLKVYYETILKDISK